MVSRWLSSKQSTCQCKETEEMLVSSLGGKDSQEEEMATLVSILAWRLQWTQTLVGYRAWGHKEEVGCNWAPMHHIILCMCVQLFFVTPWTVAGQASPSMGFSRQEYWSELPFPPPRDLADPGMESASHVSPTLQADSLLLSHRVQLFNCSPSIILIFFVIIVWICMFNK